MSGGGLFTLVGFVQFCACFLGGVKFTSHSRPFYLI